jgi:CheY-like chemotaxis protein
VRALVVDDHADAREVLEHVLRERGAEVVGVPSVDRAIELLETRPFDILISDIAMPGRDGHDLIRSVRARQRLLPAIAVTAFARPEDRQRALATGYDLHLSKPVDADRLVAAIANLVGRVATSPDGNGAEPNGAKAADPERQSESAR